MAVSIRLQRHGAIHRPFYHIVAADHRAPRDGKFIEKLGFYDPSAEPSIVNIKEDRVKYWYGRGAVLSNQTKTLFKAKKIVLERAKTHKPRA